MPKHEQPHPSATENKPPDMSEREPSDAASALSQQATTTLKRSQDQAASDTQMTGESPPKSEHFIMHTNEPERAFVDLVDFPYPHDSTTSKSRRRRPLSPGNNLPTMSQFPDAGSLPEESRTSSSKDVQWRWNAYLQKHVKLMAGLSEAAQLRRQLRGLRDKSNYDSKSLSEEVTQDEKIETQELFGGPFMEASKLNQLESQLDRLDEQLIRDIDQTLQAAPKALNMIQKRLPILLPRHHIDFRGGSTSSGEDFDAEFELHLDSPAAELLGKQREVDHLEDEILILRHDRNRIADANQTVEDETPIDADVEDRSLGYIDKKINDTIVRLKTVKAELERSRDMAITLESEVNHVPEMLVPPNFGGRPPELTSITFSNADTLVPEGKILLEKPMEPD